MERVLTWMEQRGQRNSPRWALLELFRVPHYDHPSTDYLWRLRLFQTPLCGVFLHKLCTPDPRDTLHNHPWAFASVVLRGGYTEYVPDWINYARPHRVRRLNVKRFNRSFHWIAELDRTPTWTLVFVGRRRRTWGYLDRDGILTPFDQHEFNDHFHAAMEARGGGDLM